MSKKVKVQVRYSKRIKKIPTIAFKEIKTDGTEEGAAAAVAQLIEVKTPYFEVIHGDGFKTVYQKASYQQNVNSKRVKV